MIPYPWKKKKWFHDQRMIGTAARKYIGKPLALIGMVLTLTMSWVVAFALQKRYDRVNDQWWKGGLFMVIVGAAASLALGGPVVLGSALMDFLYSFGDKATVPTKDAAIALVLAAAPIGFLLHGVSLMIDSYWYEYHAERYLNATEPTMLAKRKVRSAEKALASGAAEGDGWVKFGVIVDDPIPWRTARRGMYVERPLKAMGHGLVLGTSGVGKTITTLNIMNQCAANGAATLLLDFKGSKATYEQAKAIAKRTDRPFYSFDVGIGTGEWSWYDAFAWEGTPSEKTSMLVAAFEFAETGDASYYRNIAEQWMAVQFDLMDHVGLRDGEGRFDFLLHTSTPSGFRERLRQGLDAGASISQDKRYIWEETVSSVRPEHLASLRANISKIVNSGGARLRPRPGVPSLSLAKIAEEGAVAYIGLSPMTDGAALRGIGSLLIRDLGVLAKARMDNPKAKRNPFVVLVDEASRMGERATVMDDLITQSREGEVYVWIITQSTAAWPERTQQEMRNNVHTIVVMRIQDPAAQSEVEALIGKVPVMVTAAESSVQHDSLRGETTNMDGESRNTISLDYLIPATDFGSPNLLDVGMALVLIRGSRTRPTRKNWKSPRVRRDDVNVDIPLVHVVLPDDVMTPVDVDDIHSADTLAVLEGDDLVVADAQEGEGTEFDGPAPASQEMMDALPPAAPTPNPGQSAGTPPARSRGRDKFQVEVTQDFPAPTPPTPGTAASSKSAVVDGYWSDGTPIMEPDQDPEYGPEVDEGYAPFPEPETTLPSGPEPGRVREASTVGAADGSVSGTGSHAMDASDEDAGPGPAAVVETVEAEGEDADEEFADDTPILSASPAPAEPVVQTSTVQAPEVGAGESAVAPAPVDVAPESQAAATEQEKPAGPKKNKWMV